MAEFFDPNEDDFGAELRGTIISGGGSLEQSMSVMPSQGAWTDPHAAVQSVGSGLSEIMGNNQVLALVVVVAAVYLFRSRSRP